jgi:hypothetical protein
MDLASHRAMTVRKIVVLPTVSTYSNGGLIGKMVTLRSNQETGAGPFHPAAPFELGDTFWQLLGLCRSQRAIIGITGNDAAQRNSNMSIFLPVSKDDSRFDPKSCCRDGGYWIGAKGREQKFDLFEEALAILAKMDRPRWRRPNAAGNWGLVTGVRWENA